jgi:CubicO group peptidase (beta-lactamase class C family)
MTPEDAGFDSVRLADVLLDIQANVPNVHSVMVLRDGAVALDATFYPYDGTNPHELASVTKSVMTTLIGIAIDQERLTLDQPLVSFFPDREIANPGNGKEKVTVEHLASTMSGLDCTSEPDEPTLDEMRASDDWIQFALDRPMVAEPGTRWEYCSPDFHVLSAILTSATGMTALDFAWEYLFGPLGMREVIWPADPQGYSHGWGDLYLYPHDAAKFGQLWLNGGDWNGLQLVSREWGRRAPKPRIKRNTMGSAGGSSGKVRWAESSTPWAGVANTWRFTQHSVSWSLPPATAPTAPVRSPIGWARRSPTRPDPPIQTRRESKRSRRSSRGSLILLMRSRSSRPRPWPPRAAASPTYSSRIHSSSPAFGSTSMVAMKPC